MSELNLSNSLFEDSKNQTEIDQHIERTCYLIIQHLKNIIYFQNNIKKPWGYHSRFIASLLHPEDKLIYKGKSKTLFNDSSLARRKEHIVPMNYLMCELWALIEENNHTDPELCRLLKNHLGIAYITQHEAQQLDSKDTGLKCAMPAGWRFGIDDPLDRLKTIGIVLLHEDGQEVMTLKTE